MNNKKSIDETLKELRKLMGEDLAVFVSVRKNKLKIYQIEPISNYEESEDESGRGNLKIDRVTSQKINSYIG